MNLLKEGLKSGVVQNTDITKKLTIDGITKIYKVYKIRLDALYYNDKNDRIATWISEYTSHNTFDMSDTEAYNRLIEGFIVQSNEKAIIRTKNNIRALGQQEPGVVLSDGRIIDGNRRFTCLRQIHKDDINSTNYFEAVILEDNISRDERRIKSLELALQHGIQTRTDYNPIDRLVGIYNDIIVNKIFTTGEYAQLTDETESEIRKKVGLAKLMADYLIFIEAPEKFYIARKHELDGPLNEIYNALRRHPDDTIEYKQIKKILFLYLAQEPSGDMTRYIRDINRKIINSSFASAFIEDVMPKVEDFVKEIVEAETKGVKDPEKRLELAHENAPAILETISKIKEKYVEKENRESLQNQPLELLQKGMDCIESIDLNILEKLDKSQLDAVQKQLSSIQDKLDEVVEALNALM